MAVAVRALTEDGHRGARYVLTGPAAVRQDEQVRIIGEATGRPARWQEITREEARRRMTGSGWPEAIVDGALDHLAARITDPERITTAVEDVTGAPARSLRDWATDHAELFRRR